MQKHKRSRSCCRSTADKDSRKLETAIFITADRSSARSLGQRWPISRHDAADGSGELRLEFKWPGLFAAAHGVGVRRPGQRGPAIRVIAAGGRGTRQPNFRGSKLLSIAADGNGARRPGHRALVHHHVVGSSARRPDFRRSSQLHVAADWSGNRRPCRREN